MLLSVLLGCDSSSAGFQPFPASRAESVSTRALSRYRSPIAIGEIIYGTIGQALIRALIRSWTDDSDLLTDAGGGISDLLARSGLKGRDARRVRRELDEVAEQVSDRLSLFFEAERYGGLPKNEREAASEAVADTIERGFVHRKVLLAADLNPTKLERALRQEHPNASVLLAPLAVRLYDIALAESCAYLVQMSGDLPGFHTDAFAEVLARERSIVELLTTALENLPRTNDEQGLEFETRYLRQVAHRLDRVELLGFGAVASRKYALSVAYISLAASTSAIVASEEDLQRSPDDEGDYEESEPDVSILDGPFDREPDRSARVESILASTSRLLVRGEAGSGKTTLLQWLAVNAAKGTYSSVLEHLNRRIPFFLQLRRFSDDELPAPASFIDQVAAVVRGYMPDGWVEDQLAMGRALVLIDGVDELPAERRGEVRDWLSDLCRQFPKATYVVTSRPPAVDSDWLDGENFAQSLLEPMSMDDVGAFIEHWYEATLVADRTRQTDTTEIVNLKRAIRQSPPLRRLATSPLLCAMLCSLNKDGEQELPSDRIELYDLALEALLEKRDSQRKVIVEPGLRLSRRQKELVLQELAYWLVRNGYTDAPRARTIETLEPIVKRVVPGVSASRVYRFLLERTGLLREPVEGRVDFIHRTFLEYLAARQAVAEKDLGLLQNHAGNDTWDEIVVLAAGICAPPERLEFIQSLLELAANAKDGERRKRLQLLAVSCLDTAPELDPLLRSQLAVVLRALIPPSTIADAYDLASAGELVVPLLKSRADMRAVEARASIRTLGLVGTDAALDQLASYAEDKRKTVIRELVRQWSNFSHIEYAERVMARSPLDYGAISAESGDDLRVVQYLRRLQHLSIDGKDGTIDVASVARSQTLTRLVIQRAGGLFDLSELGPQPRLTTLELYRCPDLDSLRGIESTAVSTLVVSGARALESIGALASAHARVNALALIDVSVTDLEPLASQPELEALHLRTEIVDSLVPLAELRKLREVSVHLNQDFSLFPLIEATNLKSLTLSAGDGVIEFVPLGGPPGLDELVIQDSKHLTDARPASSIGSVQRLSLLRCPLTSLEGASDIAPIELVIQSRALRSLSGLPSSVRRLVLRDCDSLTSLEGISAANNLQSLVVFSAPALRELGDLSAIRSLTRVTFEGVAANLDAAGLSAYPGMQRGVGTYEWRRLPRTVELRRHVKTYFPGLRTGLATSRRASYLSLPRRG